VLVDVRTPMNLAVLRPVWLTLARDPRVAVAFVAEQPEAARRTLAQDGCDAALVSRSSAAWQRWDLALAADAWNQTVLRRCSRTMLFFHGVAGKYNLDAPSQLRAAALDRFDRVAFINRDRMDRYVSTGVIAEHQATLVGYPKLDELLNDGYIPAAVLRELRLEPGRPTVLYAPTFSTASSLHLAGMQIVQALLQLDVNVVVKLHDRSMIPSHHTDGIDWIQRLASFEETGRVALARNADISPLLAAANVLVTDHSTVGFEFALLDRPVVVFDAPELLAAARVAPERWTALRRMSDVVRTTSELGVAVRSALAHPERRHAERRQARELFAYPGTATARALAVVYELLELPQPTPVAPYRDAAPHGEAARAGS
jgi:hypothetical protein